MLQDANPGMTPACRAQIWLKTAYAHNSLQVKASDFDMLNVGHHDNNGPLEISIHAAGL